MSYQVNQCAVCGEPFAGLAVEKCPDCRHGELEFVCLGPGLFAADSVKLPDRRYVVMKIQPGLFNVHVGKSPVTDARFPGEGKMKPFGGLHDAKEWCRDFEKRLKMDGDEDDDEE